MPADAALSLRCLAARGELTLPLPGRGHTPMRHRALLEWGRTDLSLAKLTEAHADALAILAEAGSPGCPDSLYGVWASDGGDDRVNVEPASGRRLRVTGIKQFCSGVGLLDAALVTAHAEGGVLLLDVPLDLPGISFDTADWAAGAFSATSTGSVRFADVELAANRAIGPANWYSSRPGFWHGAVGPAACWAGGAIGLIDAVRSVAPLDPHKRAHLGALQALEWGLRALLNEAGREIDADPTDAAGMARRRALQVRHLIERACTEILDRFGRASGPRLLAFDADVARRYSELTLYIRQCHAERDLETIAALA